VAEASPCWGDAHSGIADHKLEPIGIAFHRRRTHLERDLALVGKLDGVADEVEKNLPHARGVAQECRRNMGLDEGKEIDFLAPRRHGQEVDHFIDAGGQGKRFLLEFDLPGLDLREVENLVDQSEQGVAALADGFDVLALFRRQRRVEQETGHAEHAIHRSAQLVADVGHEFRL
jgi:hypothetical protein